MILIIFIIIYDFLYIICEIWYKIFWYQEISRKIAHIWTWLITFVSLNYLNFNQYLILCFFFLISFFITNKYNFFSFLITKNRGNWEIYFIFWQIICLFFLNYSLIITKISLLILTFADWLAPLGKYIINKKIYKNKTYWGSLLFLIISLLILYFYIWNINIVIFVALVWTLWELFWLKWSDNIIIPILLCFVLLIYEKLSII